MDFTIEELSMNAWPSLQTLVYDGWIIRMSNGYGNRANSINPIYPSGIKQEEKFKHCDELFTRHGLLTTYKLTDCEEHKAIDEKLENLDYQKIHETSIQVCKIPGTAKGNSGGIIVRDDFSPQWTESVIAFNRIEEKHTPVFKKILGNVAVEKIVVHKEAGGRIIGCGYGAIERNYVGVFDIVVKEEFRGKGYGREIVEAVLSEAAKRGVTNTYLQVMLNNPAALHLYEKLGYKEIYRYWYRKKPVAS
jgi:ribosomal protein S18 acetylase RimI-like enzyme